MNIPNRYECRECELEYDYIDEWSYKRGVLHFKELKKSLKKLEKQIESRKTAIKVCKDYLSKALPEVVKRVVVDEL